MRARGERGKGCCFAAAVFLCDVCPCRWLVVLVIDGWVGHIEISLFWRSLFDSLPMSLLALHSSPYSNESHSGFRFCPFSLFLSLYCVLFHPRALTNQPLIRSCRGSCSTNSVRSTYCSVASTRCPHCASRGSITSRFGRERERGQFLQST
jgi:hypothetical protein